MMSNIPIAWLLLACHITNAQPTEHDRRLLTLPDDHALLSLNLSTTNASSSVNALEGLDIKCSGEHFGHNPSISDCESAKENLAPDHTQYAWGQRREGLGDNVFPLPYRSMGDRGLCFFQPILVGDKVKIAHASLNQIRSAANALILQCAAAEPSQGGIASNIGGDNNLHVVLGTYEPNVQCRGTFGTEASSCKDILGDMPAVNAPIAFGPSGDPDTFQQLPAFIDSSDKLCLLSIYGKKDTGSWYRIWEAMTAVWSICVRNYQGGGFRGLGEEGTMFLTVSSQVRRLQLPGNFTTDITA